MRTGALAGAEAGTGEHIGHARAILEEINLETAIEGASKGPLGSTCAAG